MSLDTLADAGFDLETTNHADAILSRAFRAEFDALCEVLLSMEIKCTEMMKGGGNEAPPTRRLRQLLNNAGWRKRNIEVTKSVDGTPRSSTTHEIDHVRDCDRGTLALEIEWNKLNERLDRGVGNPCPLLLVGLPATCVTIMSEAGISEGQP